MAKKAATTASKAKAKARPETAMTTKPGATPQLEVTVRMYCQGLGDCFLLSFPPASGDRPVRVLIDCGVFQNTPGAADKLRRVAEDIRDETDGVIDLLIVTHEHWDHVSGFSFVHDLFSKFTFKNIWLSWAENPDDPDARAIKAELGRRVGKVRDALAQARGLRARADDPAGARLDDDLISAESVLEFFGPEEARPEAAGRGRPAARGRAAASSGLMGLGQTMDWLRGQVRAGDFRSPGECRPLPGADGVNVYVLGPPRSLAALRKEDPSPGQGYGLQADRVSMLAGLHWLETDRPGAPPGPFDDRYRMSPEEARLDPFFRATYGFADDPLGDAGSAWRRIDGAWLGGLSRLALQLDTGVNNTSLALAFELPDGRTLIFPGDAQIGNWLSWSTVSFHDRDGRAVPVTTRQLLNRAVLYKVGHHGSHNATLKAGGLDEMTGGALVAMIPTDEAFARTRRPPTDGWKMPKRELSEALAASTHHRVLRADQGATELDAGAGDDATSPRWTDFRGRVRFANQTFEADPNDLGAPRPLYVEYAIPI